MLLVVDASRGDDAEAVLVLGGVADVRVEGVVADEGAVAQRAAGVRGRGLVVLVCGRVADVLREGFGAGEGPVAGDAVGLLVRWGVLLVLAQSCIGAEDLLAEDAVWGHRL